jgi:hypothetical protein
MKKALIKLKNRIISRCSGVEKIQDNAIKCRCCGEWPSTGLKKLGTIRLRSRANKTITISNALTQLNNRQALVQQASYGGVNGWLLLLCLNLTILIPASYLYEVNCILDLFNSVQSKILLLVVKNLFLYNIVLLIVMVVLAIFSFYTGLKLWNVRPKAVQTTKAFLIIQLFLIVIMVITRPLIDFPLGSNGQIFIDIMIRLVPALGNFGIWYLYLSNSRRVFNTYREIERKHGGIGHLPIKLTGCSEVTQG